MEKQFLIEGFLVDHLSNKGVSGKRIEAWGKDSKRDGLLGKVTSSVDGSFSFLFSNKDYLDYRGFAENTPKVYFKVFSKDNLLTETSPQKISTTSALNKLKRVIDITGVSKEDLSITINNWKDLTAKEDEILARIKSLPNGNRAFISNPLLCLSKVGVDLSEKFRQELIAQHPTLATKSSTVFRAIISGTVDKKLNINLTGLFKRSDK